jgi:REP element-mobilizing transposase RayT
MDKFQNKYRVQSARLQGWNYSQNGVYFITICTAGRECLFGDIIVWTNGVWMNDVETHGRASLRRSSIQLSAIGQIVNQEWDKSFEIRSELFCDAFIIMPNHLHAILRIENKTPQTPQTIQHTGIAYRSPKSISSFVAGFKSSATKQINELRGTPKLPVWQPRFYDHIIRTDAEFKRINDYINTNPEKWGKDKFYKSEEL